MDSYLRTIGTVMGIDSTWNEKLYQPVTDGRYLLKSCDCLHQVGDDDYEVRQDQSTVLFVLVFGSATKYFLVCPAWHTYVSYPMD